MRLSPHCESLLQEFINLRPQLVQLDNQIFELLQTTMQQQGIELNSIEHRIKGVESLAGKLERKGEKYRSLQDITDLIGLRIVTFYTDDVDKVAAIVSQLFDVDWSNSVDKRKLHDFNSFGYNSLHYICQLPKSLYYNPQHPELNDIRFELQMRTALQHVWSAIQHDSGYKTEIETPTEYHRSLSRLAGLLELADNEFSRLRFAINEYRRRAKSLVESGQLQEVSLDGDTFKNYLELKPFDRLNHQIAAITQAELQETSLMPYLPVLLQMGMKTLADVEKMITEQYEDAYQLALFQLGSTDIDILSESVGLQNLCIVCILKNGGGRLGLQRLFDCVNGKSDYNKTLAAIVYEQASRLAFMTNK